MQAKSTPTRYGRVAVTIHWASAVAVILAFAAGYVLDKSHPTPVPLLVVHIVLGVSVLVLTLLRIVWWAVADKRPAPLADQPRWQHLAAQAVHGLLYVVLIVMATSGIMTMVLSGAVPALLAGAPIPDFAGVLPRLVHGAMSKLLFVLFIGHVGAALYHQLIRGDRIMARMGVGG